MACKNCVFFDAQCRFCLYYRLYLREKLKSELLNPEELYECNNYEDCCLKVRQGR